MKNNRPLEVGQVRMVPSAGSGVEDMEYVILQIGSSVRVRVLSGDYKDEIDIWHYLDVMEDIVVM